jgi:hypothetical protein
MGALVIVILIAVVGYLISLRLHPYGRMCGRCKGTGIQRGAIFRYSVRQCTRCGGNQARGRYGLRTLHRGGLVWGERKPAQARERRSRNFGR